MEEEKNMNCMIVSEDMATFVTNRVIGYRLGTVLGMSNNNEEFLSFFFLFQLNIYLADF